MTISLQVRVVLSLLVDGSEVSNKIGEKR